LTSIGVTPTWSAAPSRFVIAVGFFLVVPGTCTLSGENILRRTGGRFDGQYVQENP
jgi:hypothetical protein